ncbi:hypothetical protein TSUD_370340 [Trifolium subterraneum]|uniref:F-box domain-containing protein n=1 Tax=Trifolium subterraneum TaxID=3900 RepID=A0A2Z6N6F6_TRISU|nr:hypothetical protein TSUD_370340 [Trifolium subterraneum]
MAESKPMKTDEENAIDRLSSLPDSVLFHILSFLPTKTCVSTITLISHRYLHLWKHLQVFEFHDDSQYPFEETERLKTFAAFVNSVLTLRKSRDIRKMRLSGAYSLSDTLYTNSFDTWIRAAIGPYLEELHLFIFPVDGDQFPPPPSLFTCPNIVSLSLCGGILLPLKHSSVVRLPSLKTLKLDICYEDVDSVDVLLSGCPILETLDLSFAPKSFSNIRMPRSLKMLKFTVDNNIGVCLGKLDAPNLNYLIINHVTFSSIGDLHNVLEAHLDVFPPPSQSASVESLLKLLQALSKITYLFMGVLTIKVKLGFQGYVDEVRFAEYILRNGLVLKNMIIVNALMDLKKKDSVIKKLSDIPRGSAICKLQFDSAASP